GRSSRRSSLPERVRGSERSRSTTLLGTLYGASAAAQWARRAAAPGVRPARDDDRGHRLAPALVGPADDGGLEHVGVTLEHCLDLARGDVLATADDRVRLASGHRQPSVLVDLAEIAGM